MCGKITRNMEILCLMTLLRPYKSKVAIKGSLMTSVGTRFQKLKNCCEWVSTKILVAIFSVVQVVSAILRGKLVLA
jgi:hypothetical protein